MGMTQDDLARRINVNRATVANWEIGRTSPDYTTIMVLADLFGVTTDWLLGRIGHTDENPGLTWVANHGELTGVWQELTQRESLQVLLGHAAGMSDDALTKLIAVVKMMKSGKEATGY
jgi:transcriptional regulator with XRE-family HTH domain